MTLSHIEDISFYIRPFVFFTGFLVFSILGRVFSFRNFYENNLNRNFNNLSLAFVNSVLQFILKPFTLIYIASKMNDISFGLFNLFSFNYVLELIVSLLLLDLIIYFQHILTHKVHFLWRLHRVHHTDVGFDTSTALRFHPFEILFSFAFKAVFIVILGVAPLSVLIFEIVLNFCAMFNHSNFSFSKKSESFLRSFLVTPDMHRVHHSVRPNETDSNFGFCLSFWDRIFSTYKKSSYENPQKKPIGLKNFREMKDQKIFKLLSQPFR